MLIDKPHPLINNTNEVDNWEDFPRGDGRVIELSIPSDTVLGDFGGFLDAKIT